MSIVISKQRGSRGKKDAKRHREKQKEVIRKKLPEIVSEENIITRSGKKKIKVPIRGIVIPDFRPGTRKKDKKGNDKEKKQGGAAGIGQGSGSPGDVIGRKPGQEKGKGKQKAGGEPGKDYIESEIDIEEIIEMMYEDLGLPDLKDKNSKDLEVILGFKLRGIKKSGPQALEFDSRIAQNFLARFWAYLEILKEEKGKTDIECFDALKAAEGNLGEALDLLGDPEFVSRSKEIEPFPVVDEDDLRYHDLRENKTFQSNAVIFIELDVSYSMDMEKRYLARSMMFWLVEFLRKVYDNVDVKFIVYHGEAKMVSEHDAFHTSSVGGTISYKAHELVIDQIMSKYPKDKWNSYVFHFSDGDDFDPEVAIKRMRKLLGDLNINMFGYCEIKPRKQNSFSFSQSLFSLFKKKFDLDHKKGSDSSDPEMLIGKKQKEPIVASRISSKEHIWPTIKELLKKERRFQ